MIENKPEIWMRGPIEGMPVLVQPIAFALLQAREEVIALMNDFPEALLWLRPAELASPGFHLQHLTGVLDRLFTYAENEQLTEKQLKYLKAEGKPENMGDVSQTLVDKFSAQVDHAIERLKAVDVNKLTEPRGVGRSKLPSTVIGLYTHSAEHSMRHVGQLLVTIRILNAASKSSYLNLLVE